MSAARLAELQGDLAAVIGCEQWHIEQAGVCRALAAECEDARVREKHVMAEVQHRLMAAAYAKQADQLNAEIKQARNAIEDERLQALSNAAFLARISQGFAGMDDMGDWAEGVAA